MRSNSRRRLPAWSANDSAATLYRNCASQNWTPKPRLLPPISFTVYSMRCKVNCRMFYNRISFLHPALWILIIKSSSRVSRLSFKLKVCEYNSFYFSGSSISPFLPRKCMSVHLAFCASHTLPAHRSFRRLIPGSRRARIVECRHGGVTIVSSENATMERPWAARCVRI